MTILRATISVTRSSGMSSQRKAVARAGAKVARSIIDRIARHGGSHTDEVAVDDNPCPSQRTHGWLGRRLETPTARALRRPLERRPRRHLPDDAPVATDRR